MLTVTALGNAEYVLGAVAAGIDEYYVGEGEAPGVWHGRLAAALDLEGIVIDDDLRALVVGDRPGSGRGLLEGHRRRTVAAIDLTFSADASAGRSRRGPCAVSRAVTNEKAARCACHRQ